ncbi:MAG TPA: hypothetical protein VFU02_09740 [Polyangiaceae bacterium]|nr:hypothetical protein [Polyangiaceae bacterium]
MVALAVSPDDVPPPEPVVDDELVTLAPAVVVVPVVTFEVPPVVVVPLELFAAPVVLTVCVVPFEVLPLEVLTVDPDVWAAALPVVFPEVVVPSVPESLLAGSLPQWTSRAREVNETRKREEVRLSIAVLKGKRTESHA